MVGLSGLITPSLDEMVYVAKEMQRQGFEIPLLIGGATTSRMHTSVKIAPQFEGVTAHVLDASRVVNVVSELMDPERRPTFDAKNRAEQKKVRDLFAMKQARPSLPWDVAKENGFKADFGELPAPEFLGRRAFDGDLRAIREYIDWTLFFSAWDLKGKYPKILEHPKIGEAARELFEDGTALLTKLIDEKLVRARGVYGFWPANRDGEDVVLWTDESRTQEAARFPMLRQQAVKQADTPYYSLADFVDSSGKDYVGAFAVTAGLGAAELVAEYEAKGDDYHAIMVKALCDRLAEAFAEMLHARVRKEWGYSPDEDLSNEELIRERYRGIRPAFGYPACPDHTPKGRLWELLDAAKEGIELTEHFAMTPAASVSGLYFAHEESRYFAVGKIDRDQVEDYAARSGLTVAEAERWLGPNLAY